MVDATAIMRRNRPGTKSEVLCGPNPLKISAVQHRRTKEFVDITHKLTCANNGNLFAVISEMTLRPYLHVYQFII